MAMLNNQRVTKRLSMHLVSASIIAWFQWVPKEIEAVRQKLAKKEQNPKEVEEDHAGRWIEVNFECLGGQEICGQDGIPLGFQWGIKHKQPFWRRYVIALEEVCDWYRPPETELFGFWCQTFCWNQVSTFSKAFVFTGNSLPHLEQR